MKINLAEYDKNILKLFSGTAIAQLISFIMIPIIAKKYGPQEYGIYAGILASISVLSPLTTGKYELAIMLPDNIKEVFSLIKLCNWINILVCAIVFLLTAFLPMSFLNWILGIDAKIRYIFLLIPISTFFLGAFQILNYQLIREKKFQLLSTNKILRTSLFAFFAFLFGLYWPYAVSLALALALSHFISNVFLRIKTKQFKFLAFPTDQLEKKEFIGIAQKYKQYPTYILPAELINVFCAQLPIFVFLWAFQSKESGYFSFIITLLNVPISLLAGAILDVFKERASTEYKQTGSCQVAYQDTIYKMLIISIIPFILLFFFGNEIVVFLFGESWKPAGKFLDILLYMFFLKFISSPLSFIFYIVHKQKEDFLWHVYILISTIIVLFIGAVVFKDIIVTVKLYAINFSVIYLIYLIRSFQLSRAK